MKKQVVQNLKKDVRIDYIVPDYEVKVIESVSASPFNNNIKFSGEITPWGIDRVDGPLNGTGKTAWILDTGIDLDHPDLNVNFKKSVSFIAEESANDLSGHGTHVAGILAAKDNSRDVVGVAAGATVVSVKVIDQNGHLSISEVTDGIDYIANNASPNDIINMSLRFPVGQYDTKPLEDAVSNAANAGIRFAIAAGNDQQHANNASPARVNNSNIWTVSAYDDTDAFATSFSNYGNPPIEYSGPGVNVLSLWNNGGTNTISGTSMATPHVAGLLLAAPLGITTDGSVSNDPDGNADPIAVARQDQPLSVSVTGPYILDSGETGTWSADVSNNEGSISYQW